jgi:Na+-translocating ferredoxin:NAD+ oxidoreductase RNF subunit RnfB
MRVVPVNIQIDAQHQVYPYEDLRRVLEKAKSFQVMECICKKERAMMGEPCKYPVEVCLAFANKEDAFDKYPMGRVISREEALDVIKKADEAGLVHATYNVQSGQMFVCNCCPCCCGMLRGTREHNAPHLMARSNYVAAIDQESCAACGTCADERCPVKAISDEDGSYRVQPDRCIGCGVCVPSCPTESITLVRKPESEHDQPPANLMDWYFKRAENRGVKILVE